MKLELTKAQIEAIQKLLWSHSGAGGIIPNSNVCYRAFANIENQTGIRHVTERDLENGKKELNKLFKDKK